MPRHFCQSQKLRRRERKKNRCLFLSCPISKKHTKIPIFCLAQRDDKIWFFYLYNISLFAVLQRCFHVEYPKLLRADSQAIFLMLLFFVYFFSVFFSFFFVFYKMSGTSGVLASLLHSIFIKLLSFFWLEKDIEETETAYNIYVYLNCVNKNSTFTDIDFAQYMLCRESPEKEY